MMRDAEAAQARIEKNEQLSLIDGIPIAIKDNILVKGMQSSAASLILKDFKAPIDSTAVSKLRKAGAIITG
jgi:aspartyl-tRNA(Asn)/glutamyl-tRNA(Gln) amidotransferase subunit A